MAHVLGSMSTDGELRQSVSISADNPDEGGYRDSTTSSLYYNSRMIRIPFVYLASLPFSGSTLFSFLVNTHPQITTVGEMTGPTPSQDPEKYECSCGQKIRECTFWKFVAEQMASRSLSFDPGTFDVRIQLGNGILARRILSGSLGISMVEDIRDGLLKLLPWHNQRFQYLVARRKALAMSILQVTGRPVLFDSSKNHMTIRHLRSQSDVDLRVVHLVRDVRGVSLSKRKNRLETNWRRGVNAWVRGNRSIERQLRRLPADRWIRIRYEDLCRTPEATLHRFFEFCGLEPHAMALDFSTQEHHIVGNRMRLSNIGQISLNEDWRRVLTPDELALAWKLAGPLHVRYGYPPMTTAELSNARMR